MGTNLRKVLKLPERRSVAGTSKSAPLFRNKFRQQMDGLNQKMRVLAATVNHSDYQSLNDQRSKLYAAYQQTSSNIDSDDPQKGEAVAQRVLSAVSSVDAKVSRQASNMQAARSEWLKHEEALGDALQQIGELEQAGYPNAATYRKVAEEIRGRSNTGKFKEATVAFSQLKSKLDKTAVKQQMQTHSRAEGASSKGYLSDADAAGFESKTLKKGDAGVEGVDIDRDVEQALALNRQYSESQNNVERIRMATELIEIYERLQALLAQAPMDAEGRPVLTGEVQWNPDPAAPLSGTLEDIMPFGAIDAWRAVLRHQGVQEVHQPVKPLTIESVFTFLAETSTLTSDITRWIDDNTYDGRAVDLVGVSNLREVLRSLAESADEGERVLFRASLSGGEWHHDSVTFRAFRLTPPPPGNFPLPLPPEERARIILERKRQILRGQLDFSAPPPAQGDDRQPRGGAIIDQMIGYRKAWELYLLSGDSEGAPYQGPAQGNLELGRQRAVREIHNLMRQPAWVIQAVGAASDELIRLLKRQEERVGRVYSGEDPKPGPKKTAPAKAKQTVEPTRPAAKVKSRNAAQKKASAVDAASDVPAAAKEAMTAKDMLSAKAAKKW